MNSTDQQQSVHKGENSQKKAICIIQLGSIDKKLWSRLADFGG